MNSTTTTIAGRTTIEALRMQLAEDPHREPHEKETALHLEGDGTHFSVTSFKKVVYGKLLQRPEFDVKAIHLLDTEGREHTASTLGDAASHPESRIIGVTGNLPVGSINIGTPRRSNSHAHLVK